MLKNLFNITNTGKHKAITIFGLKLQINMLKNLRKKKFPIENKIVFCNYMGKSFGCNPKYITEEIIRRNLPLEIVWLVKDKQASQKDFPKNVRVENYYSPEGIKELLSAKFWVDNHRKRFFWENGFKKNANQIYIQTWHGSLGIKKIEGAIAVEDEKWRKFAKIDSQNIDYLLSGSSIDSECMKKSFWFDGEIIKTGYPRNDIFFANQTIKDEIKTKVHKSLNIPSDYKIALYVPTFRDSEELYPYYLDAKRIISTFENKFNAKFILAIRLHPNTKSETSKIFRFSDNVIDATDYPDIQELLAASDTLLTDYSSSIFDFMLSKKPAFIYANDIEQYINERGFYYPLETLPFSIARDNYELVKNIEDFDFDKYQKDIDNYITANDYIADGKASIRVVDIIEKILNKS